MVMASTGLLLPNINYHLYFFYPPHKFMDLLNQIDKPHQDSHKKHNYLPIL